MVFRPSIDEKLCFVLMPFKNPFNGYYKNILKKAAADVGLEAKRADDIYGIRPVMHDIWDSIWNARIVIADVTEKNPNVNYELGLCHALGVPTVLITKTMDDVPFDYRHRRVIVYTTDEAGWEQKLRKDLKHTLETVLKGKDNWEDLKWPYEARASEASTLSSLLSVENPRDIVIEGTTEVKRVVAKAFGPAGLGRSITIGNREQITYREGLDILRNIKSANPLQQRGINEMQLVAQETLNYVGDGSKTAILLAQAMIEYGNEALKREYLPRDVIQGMKKAVDITLNELEHRAKRANNKQVIQVAATAATNPIFGKLIEEAFDKVGQDGVVTIEESRTKETFLEVTEGMEFDSGYLSPYFVTNPETGEVVLDNALILITDKKLSSMREMLPLIEQIASNDKTFLIIASDVEGEALATLVVNRLRGTLKVVAVKAPATGDRKRVMLEDIAILTGGKFINEHFGIKLESIQLADLGTAGKVIVTGERTTIIEGGGKVSDIEGRVKALRMQLDEVSSDYDRAKIADRLAKLVGGVAIIRVGGVTKIDVIDNKYKLKSAMFSAKAAIEKGWIPGGGLSLYLASKSVRSKITGEGAEAAGMNAVAQALEVPLQMLIANTGVSYTQALSEINKRRQESFGFNVDTKQVESLVKAGVLDCVKMINVAIEIAFSHVRAVIQTSEWDLAEPESQRLSGAE